MDRKVYSGDKLLKNLNMPTQINCKTLPFVGRQLIFLNQYGLCYQGSNSISYIDCGVSESFFESRLFSAGYQAEQV